MTNSASLQEFFKDNLSYSPNHLKNQVRVNQIAQTRALNLFKLAAQRVPAYKDFLNQHSISWKKINNIQEFQQVPFTSKNNYIYQYSLKDRCWDGDITKAHAIAASSGTHGEPVFWPRNLQQELDGALIHELLLKQIFRIDKKKTLFINSLGLGNWIAGMYTQMCLYLTQARDNHFTLASPGFSEPETFKIIKEFSQHYDQTILFCHPPVLKIMVENAKSAGIQVEKLNLRFFGTGEGFSENFRDYLSSLTGQSDPYTSFINIFGSADAGLMGFETPMSIFIRRLVTQFPDLNQAIFKSERIPYIYQYDPRFKYMETITDELTLTADATMPLIRYNIHDHGYLMEYSQLFQHIPVEQIHKIKQDKIDVSAWQFPFIYMYGRKQAAVTLMAVNIYPENIKAALEHPKLQSSITNRYKISKKETKNQKHYIDLVIELKPGKKPSPSLKERIKGIVISTLKAQNSEYNQVESRFGKLMHPRIKLVNYQDPILFPADKIKKLA